MSGTHISLLPSPARITTHTCFRCGQPTAWVETAPTHTTAGGWAVGTYGGCTTCDQP